MTDHTKPEPRLPPCRKCGAPGDLSIDGHRGFDGPTVYHDCQNAPGMPQVVFGVLQWIERNRPVPASAAMFTPNVPGPKWDAVRQRLRGMSDPLTLDEYRSGMLNEEDAEQFYRRVIDQRMVWWKSCMWCGTTRRGLLHFCWLRRLWQRVTGKRRGTVQMFPDPRR